MSRTGVELKPTWKSVPAEVRRAVGDALGSEVVRAMRIWGGYSATPTFRLRTAEGRRAFFKGSTAELNEFVRASHSREERIYLELGDVIAAWSPGFYAALHVGGWDIMLLQDLGPKSAPPWKPAVIRGVARDFGAFHRQTMGMVLPEWLPRPSEQLMTSEHVWHDVARNGARAVSALAGDHAGEARRWFNFVLPELMHVSSQIGEIGHDYSLIHRDVRSDNLRWFGGHLRLLDWPHAGVGPAEYDAAVFVQSVTVEGGPQPEQVMQWYAEQLKPRSDALDVAVAALAGFFAAFAPLPDIPGLPRLRGFQRAQLRVTLAWAARRLSLPEPVWLNFVA